MKIQHTNARKQYGCDGCGQLTEIMPERYHVPHGWVKVEQKAPSGYWESKLFFCPECGEFAVGYLQQAIKAARKPKSPEPVDEAP